MKKRAIALIIATLMLTALFASCGTATGTPASDATSTPPAGSNESPGADKTPDGGETPDDGDETPAPVEREPKDLGGIEVRIANWWSASDDLIKKAEKGETTALEEATLDYRNKIQADNNATIKNIVIGAWGECQEKIAAALMSQTQDAEVYTLDSGWIYSMLSRGLFYDVASLPSYQEALQINTNDKWNMLVKDLMTFGDKTYGFATGYEPRNGLFFNKRLLEDAGIDPESLYNHQADGTWTWAAFEEMCAKTTRDINQDGTTDTWAITTFSSDFIAAVVFSNNAEFVGKNDDGTIYNAIYEPNFLEALQFNRKLNDAGYIQPKPSEDLNWDWFIAAFNEGQAAFRVAEEYSKDNISKTLVDDFGFVAFPQGPQGTGELLYRENTLVIPYYLDAELADKVFYAYDLWTDPIPGYEDSEDWKIAAYSFYDDERAVDETLAMMRLGEKGKLRNEALAGFSNDQFGALVWNIWDAQYTPAELVETVRVDWDTRIAEANEALKKLG